MLCRICTAVQILPRNHVLDNVVYTPPTRQHELDHTDHTDQEYISPALKGLHHELSQVRILEISVGYIYIYIYII